MVERAGLREPDGGDSRGYAQIDEKREEGGSLVLIENLTEAVSVAKHVFEASCGHRVEAGEDYVKKVVWIGGGRHTVTFCVDCWNGKEASQ